MKIISRCMICNAITLYHKRIAYDRKDVLYQLTLSYIIFFITLKELYYYLLTCIWTMQCAYGQSNTSMDNPIGLWTIQYVYGQCNALMDNPIRLWTIQYVCGQSNTTKILTEIA